MIGVMFVCLGNICRSPTAHGVFESMVREAGLVQQISVTSSGTAAWHVGKPPDVRATAAALARGYQLDHLRAQQITIDDFSTNDYILVMDRSNLSHLQALAPQKYADRLRLFLDFAGTTSTSQVPDPYYGGTDGFDHVLDLIEDGARGLLAHIEQERMDRV